VYQGLLREDAHRALMRALEYTLEHPEEAGEFQAEVFPEAGSAAVHSEEIARMADFCYGGLQPGQPLGYIDDAKVVRSMGLLRDVGELEDDFNHAMTPPDGVGDEGVVNYLFVPGVEDQ
jgi:hypothetical protein